MPVEYDMVLQWARDHCDYQCASGQFAYGVFKKGKPNIAVAILVFNYTKEGRKWLKMLDLHLSPSFDVGFNEESMKNPIEISSIFSAAIVGALGLTSVHRSKTLKLYARSASLLSFFKGLAPALAEPMMDFGLKVSIEGRWMVFAQHR